MANQNSIVLELQMLAVSESSDISELLRKALLVAEKLNLVDFAAWIRKEINGYSKDEEIPEYRQIRTHVKGVHSGLGIETPVTFDNPEIATQILLVKIPDPISGLVEVLNSGKQIVEIALPPEWEKLLMSQIAAYPVRYTSSNTFASIIEAVRTEILDVALNLEKEGIIGEGIAFSKEEKDKATESLVFNIGSIGSVHGIIGAVTNSEVHQYSMEINQGDASALVDYLKSLNVTDEDIEELQLAIQEEPALSENNTLGTKVRKWLSNMIAKAASGTWQISIATAADLLARAIYAFYGATPPS